MTEHGRPPKSIDSIRSRLEKISKTMTGERINDRQVVVASFQDHQIGKMFRDELKRRGLFPESAVKQRRLVVSVDHRDMGIASPIARTFREKYPDRRPARDSARFDGLVFGSVIGLTVGLIFIIEAPNDANAREFAIAMLGCGMAAGHLLDRYRVATARGNKVRFGVWEFLIVVAMLAISIVALRDFAALLK